MKCHLQLHITITAAPSPEIKKILFEILKDKLAIITKLTHSPLRNHAHGLNVSQRGGEGGGDFKGLLCLEIKAFSCWWLNGTGGFFSSKMQSSYFDQLSESIL